MSSTVAPSNTRGNRERRIVIGLLIIALLGLAFSPGTEGAIQRALGRSVGNPSGETADGARQLAEPTEADVPVALAATAQAAPSTSAAPLPRLERTEAVAEAVTTVTADQAAVAPSSTQAPQVAAASAAPKNDPDPSPSRPAPTPEPERASPATTVPPAAAPTTTTTAAPTTTTTAPTTTAAPATTAAPTASAQGGWVSPAQTGHRTSNLHPFAAANDGPAGVTIDQAFLDANNGAPWLVYEGGRPVISRMDASGRCLNILVTITLRDSLINCPTRVQNDTWGYAGQVDDAPAVNVLAQNVIIEHNTITCSGHDGNICSRSVRAGSSNTTVRYNDLSYARGAVATYHGTVFRYNYVHDLSFGFDPTRAGSADNVTHNNAVNNLGYSNVLIEGNYIVARYGRVSAQPGTYRAPSFHGVYAGGIVEVGDPINGFVFANYLVNGNGSNFRVLDNYVVGAGRPFQCNGSSRHSGASCGADVSGNAFASDRFVDFTPAALFYDSEGAGSISGSCNVRSVSGGFQVLPADAFGNAGTHGTSGC